MNINHFRRFLALAVSAVDLFGLSGCEQGQPESLIYYDPSNLCFDAAGGERTVAVTANRDWTAETTAGWLTITPAAGEAARTGVTVKLTAKSNECEAERTATVTFKAEGVEKSLTVMQAGKIPDPLLSIDKSEFAFNSSGGEFTVRVTHNVDYEIRSDVNWITQSLTRASATDELHFTVEANPAADARTGRLTFLSKDGTLEQEVVVTQAGKPSLVLNRSKLDFAAAGGAESVTVTSNRDWTAETTASWLTIVPASGGAAKTGTTVKLTAKANDSEAERTATVTFKAEGVEKILTVTQARKIPDPSLVLDRSKVDFAAAGGSESLTLTSNRDWTAETTANWLTIVPASGKAAKTGVTVKLTAKSNESESERTATVTFKAEGIEKVLTVTQAGKIPDPMLSIDKNEFAFNSSGGEFTVRVTHNVDYKIHSDVDWIVQSLTRASATDELHFSVAANPAVDARTGRLTFRSKDGTLEQEVVVTQAGKPSLVLDRNKVSFAAAGGAESVTLTSNRDWTAKTTASWLTIVPATGKAAKTGVPVKLTAKANDSEAERTATVTFKTEGIEKVLTVTQAGKIPDPSLVLERSKVNFAAAGGAESLTVTSNRDWTARTSADWLTIVPASGKAARTGVTVKLTAKANESEAARTATVTFTAEGIEKVLTVTQAGKIPDPVLSIDKSEFVFNSSGGEFTVNVTHNVDYKIHSDVDWIVQSLTRASATDELHFSVAANPAVDARTGRLTFRSKDGTLEQEVVVTQAGKPSLIPDRSKLNFTAAGGAESVSVTSNRDWTAKTSANWLTITPISGKASKTGTTVKLTTKSNDSESERTATVTFRAEGIEKVLTVTQAGKIPDPSLVLDRSRLDFAAAGGAESLTLTSNRDWTAKTTANWLTIVPASGKASKTGTTVKLTAKANDSESERTATVTFTAEGIEKSLTVTQAGKIPDPSLVLDRNRLDFAAAGGAESVTLTSNRDWTAKTTASWLTIVPASGKALKTGTTVKLTAKANDSESERTATVTFKAEGVEKVLTVTQAGKIPEPLLSIDKSDFAFKSSGGEFTVNVTHNVDYEIRSDVDWIAQSLTRAAVTDELHFSVEANPSMEARTGRLTFLSSDGTLRREATVTQHGVETLTVSPKTFDFDCEAHAFEVSVTANVDYELHSDVSWIKKNLTQSGGAGTLHFSVAANQTTDARTGRLTFLSTDGTLKQEVVVRQKEASVLVETAFGMQLRLVRVKGGTFWMGAQSTDADGRNYDSEARDWEGPVHQVTLSDYYIGCTEVTFEQFSAFVDATGYETDADKGGGSYIWNRSSWSWVLTNGVNWRCDVNGNPRGVSDSKHPVVHVSWNDAAAYCQWLSQQTGKRYVLSTEAQWEYAARGGNKSNGYKYSGSNSGGSVAWYYDNSGQTTHPVGTKSPNELGLYDMSGNVWEWCADYWGSYSADSQTNPQGPSSGFGRMVRGGSYLFSAGYCRVSCRAYGNPVNPDTRYGNLGFRLALLP